MHEIKAEVGMGFWCVMRYHEGEPINEVLVRFRNHWFAEARGWYLPGIEQGELERIYRETRITTRQITHRIQEVRKRLAGEEAERYGKRKKV